jgi:hypothetical protein
MQYTTVVVKVFIFFIAITIKSNPLPAKNQQVLYSNTESTMLPVKEQYDSSRKPEGITL